MLEAVQGKIMDSEGLSRRRAGWSLLSQSVVFTNGVFDLLHRGHLTYLWEARALGQQLIVGLNSDASVRRLGKGADRPILPEADRAFQLAALACVDAIVIFEEDTPRRLIESLLPDVLVKGGDYTIDQIVGAQEVMANGGEVKVIPFLDGYSSTKLIERIRG
ncbi:MAG: D-glycero-beta-D-manno-heptose 1-phosphate adenylyltransferase [Bacteroidota bacterium]